MKLKHIIERLLTQWMVKLVLTGGETRKCRRCGSDTKLSPDAVAALLNTPEFVAWFHKAVRQEAKFDVTVYCPDCAAQRRAHEAGRAA